MAKAAPPTASIGFRAHTGWTAAVAVATDAGSMRVIERRRVELRDEALPLEMYHVASSKPPAEAVQLIRDCTKASRIVGRREIKALKTDLEREGYRIDAAGVVLGSGRLMLPLDAALRSHAGCHAAEGELYRQAVLHACEALGLPVTAVAEPELYDFASAALDLTAARVRDAVGRMGNGLGPPWRQDQKNAALVAWLAMRAKRPRLPTARR